MINKNIFINRKLVFLGKHLFDIIALKVKQLKDLSVVNTLSQKYLFTFSGDKHRYIVRKARKYINLVQCHYFSKVKNASGKILNISFYAFSSVKNSTFEIMNVVFRRLCLGEIFDLNINGQYNDRHIIYQYYSHSRAILNCSADLNSIGHFCKCRGRNIVLNEISRRLCHLTNIMRNGLNANSNKHFNLKASLCYYWIIALIHGIYCYFHNLYVAACNHFYRGYPSAKSISHCYISFKSTFNYLRSSNHANIN